MPNYTIFILFCQLKCVSLAFRKMKQIQFTYYLTLGFLCFAMMTFSQENASMSKKEVFSIKGNVRESDTYKPISKVSIQVNGGLYTTTNNGGDFRIQAAIGDELIISHDDFSTVYYTIKSSERITVEVQPEVTKKISNFKSRSGDIKMFKRVIDSAEFYKKKDVTKSFKFIEDALLESNSTEEQAEAYEVLADVFIHLEQYDLAVSNFKISLQNTTKNEVSLKLGKAYLKNGEVQNSINTYQGISIKKLSNYQKVQYYEGLGDAKAKQGSYSDAVASFNLGLDVAKKHLITPKITDLNSKIADALSASGNVQEAQNYYGNSLNLAEKENKTRAIKERVKVADFENSNQAYDDEIVLRKEALEDIADIETDSVINNESPLTSQKQNYKIGNAYFLQKDYVSAIPYLEKSIDEANTKADLVVKKDATRKLSEVYRDAGSFEKALDAYESYTNLVEELYIQKEQEISQAVRFSRDYSDKQNRIKSLESDKALTDSVYQLSTEKNKRQELIIYSLIGGVILLLISGYFMYTSMRQQKLANNLLALKTLRSQMNPHFIFNALNSVNSFIASNDERTANKYLTDFSQLMRSVLENSEQDFISLKKEIDLLEIYTKLEHFRFKDKFDYTITVDEAINTEVFQIPPMLLQPYIENAVWHGLRYKETKGVLNISIAKKTDEEITITIADDGIGRQRSKALKTDHQKKQNSKGMGNIKKRVAILNAMYKDKVDVFIDDFQNAEDAGTKVVVTLKKD